jgi:multidrug transporter EmrE-like cation transporter
MHESSAAAGCRENRNGLVKKGVRRMTLASLAIILVSVTVFSVAQIALKLGVSADPGESARAMLGPMAMLATPGVIIGLTLYAAGTMLWLVALQRLEISQAYPFVGLGFALTTLAGWCLFGDDLSLQRLGGIALIVVGTTFVAQS